MKNEVCIVTGASSGLGRALSELLCEKGYTIYVVARSKDKLEKLKQQTSKLPGKIEIISGDLTDSKFRENLISEVIKKQGKIDFLFNNAGFGKAMFLEKMSNQEIQLMFNLNIVAYSHLSSLALTHMKKADKGRIINTGSVVAFTPLPYFTVYNATKSAVYAFNRSLRYELKGTNITSTVVLPARMKTDFAKQAFNCEEINDRKKCVEEFNKMAGSPYLVAKKIINKMDSGKEVILPTFLSFLWYSTRYTGFLVDFAMKNFLGPKQEKSLNL